MLSLFKNLQNPIIHLATECLSDLKFVANYAKEKIINKFVLSSKEWFSSVYSFNKSATKSKIITAFLTNILLRAYFNMSFIKISVLKRRRHNIIRYSANKVYISRAEFLYTNSTLTLILSAFNKKRKSLAYHARKVYTLFDLKKRVVKKKILWIKNHKNRVFHLCKKNVNIFNKWNIAFFKENSNLFYNSFITEMSNKYFEAYIIPNKSEILLNKVFTLEKFFNNCMKNIHSNIAMFSISLVSYKNLGLLSLVIKMVKSAFVKMRMIDLKSLHLNSDTFASAVALKLRDRKNKAIRILRKAVNLMVNIPYLHTLITFDNTTKSLNKNNVIDNMKQQVVSGVRFEAAGRLTRRLTAMRAVFKYRYEGTLKNIRSSFNSESATMLRGYLKSNLQHYSISEKTRNGAYGLETWVSSHIFNFSLELFSKLVLSTIGFIEMWVYAMISLLLLTPFLILSNGSKLDKKRYHISMIYFCIVALLSIPGIDLPALLNFFFYNVFPKLLQLQPNCSITELSVLHIIMLPISIVMLGLNSLNNKKSTSLFTKITFIINIIKNPYKLLLTIVCLLVFNFLFNSLGLYVISTDNYLLFITLLCRFAFLKIFISLLFFVVTKDTKKMISNLSLSFTDVFMIFFSSIVYIHCLMPLLQTFASSNHDMHFDSYLQEMESNMVYMSVGEPTRTRAVFTFDGRFANTTLETPLRMRQIRMSGLTPFIQIANSVCPGQMGAHSFQDHYVANPLVPTPGQTANNGNPMNANSGQLENNGNPMNGNPGQTANNGNSMNGNSGQLENNGNPMNGNPGQTANNGNPMNANSGQTYVHVQWRCPNTICGRFTPVVHTCVHCTLACCPQCY